MPKDLHSKNGAAFDAETVSVLAAAFDEAWQSLQTAGVYFKSRYQAEATRELLAVRIIEAAKLGERDQHRLREDTLLHLAQSNLVQLNSRSPGL